MKKTSTQIQFFPIAGSAAALLALTLISSCSPSAPTTFPELSEQPSASRGSASSSAPAGASAATKRSKNSSSTASKENSESSVKLGEITVVSIDHLFGLKQAGQVMLVDCRPGLFYRVSHIDGAVSYPLKNWKSRLPEMRAALDAAVEANKIIVLYCQSSKCPDSYNVAHRLSKLGYSVTIYKGGWDEWKSAGF